MNTKIKHTPGPWSMLSTTIESESGRGICLRRSMTPDNKINTEIQANEQLICASPDMFSALSMVSNKITDGERRQVIHGGELGVYMSLAEIDSIRAAIAKAKGE